MEISKELLDKVTNILIMYRISEQYRKHHNIGPKGLAILLDLQSDYTEEVVDDVINELGKLKGEE